MLEIRLLGQFEIRREGETVDIPSRPAQSLLAYLSLNAGTSQRREKLAGLLWPESNETNARSNLRHALWRLRKAVGTCPEPGRDYIHADDLTITFDDTCDVWLDAAVLEQKTAESWTADELMRAVSAYEGELLPGFYDEWVTLERERLQALYGQKMGLLLERLADEGRWGEVLEWGERWIALGQVPEPAYRALMLAHGGLGDQSSMASVYQRCLEDLAGELGVEPSEKTRKLYERLLKGNVYSGTTAVAAALLREPRTVGECPYRGLAAFREDDAAFFFGRESFTERLFNSVNERSSITVVVGSSGSGKSSAVYAGLLPRLRDVSGGDWLIIDFRPGREPFHALAAVLLPALEPDRSETERLIESRKLAEALGEGQIPLGDAVKRALEKTGEPRHLLLLVDQFEELYTLCKQPGERQRFLDVLLTTVGTEAVRGECQNSLLLTLRADFLGQALAHRRFAELLQEGALMLAPMTRDRLQAAIEKPAEKQGAAFEVGLVARLLDDVVEEPGNLPLLEFALTLLWERLDHGWMTHAAYEEIGRAEGALARYAEEVYEDLDLGEQERARRVFLQLVQPGEGTEDIRRLATRAELGDPDADWALVKHLADKRLVVTGRDPSSGIETVEVVHEALIQGWGRLRAWVERDRAFRLWQERLRAALRSWEASDRDEGALLRGAPLAEAEGWWVEHEAELSMAEVDFIQVAIALRDRRQVERERRRHRLTLAAAATAAVFLIMAMLGGAGWWQAEQRREQVEDQRQVALSRLADQLTARATGQLDAGNDDLALLLATEALRVAETSEGYAVFRQAFSRLRPTLVTISGHADRVLWVEWNTDGSRILTASNDGTARVWDSATGAELLTLSGHSDGVNMAVWNSGEDRILTASNDGTARVWDADTGAELLILPDGSGRVSQAAWNADESHILTASSGGGVLWNAKTGARLLVLSGPDLSYTSNWRIVNQAALSSDDSRILTAGTDGVARVWDAETGMELLTLSGHTGGVNDAQWSVDDRRILTAGSDGTARVWDAETGAALLTLSGHSGRVWQAAWNDDESRILTASSDGTARVWDTDTGDELLILSGHAGTVRWAAWNADETRILTTGWDGTARAWDARTGAGLFMLTGHAAAINRAVWSADESRIVTASSDGTARVWDASTDDARLTISGHGDAVRQAVWSADGSRILTASDDATARVWDAETGAELRALRGHTAAITGAVWNSNESRILTSSSDGTARVWDAETGAELLNLAGHTRSVVQAKWNSDESRILSTSVDGTARIWDAETGAELLAFSKSPLYIRWTEWNPEGTRILTIGWDCKAQVWDAETGAELLTLTGHRSAAVSGWSDAVRAVWNAEGSRILTVCSDGTAWVWDAETGAELLMFRDSDVTWATWNADESRILTARDDGTARVWDAETGTELLTLSGHTGSIRQAVWNVDKSRILTASDDGTARVWDAETGAELRTLGGHADAVTWAAWNADESRILTASRDGTVRQWYTDESLLEFACQRAPRNMTRDEWRRFMGNEPYRATCSELPLPED